MDTVLLHEHSSLLFMQHLDSCQLIENHTLHFSLLVVSNAGLSHNIFLVNCDCQIVWDLSPKVLSCCLSFVINLPIFHYVSVWQYWVTWNKDHNIQPMDEWWRHLWIELWWRWGGIYYTVEFLISECSETNCAVPVRFCCTFLFNGTVDFAAWWFTLMKMYINHVFCW